MINDNGNDYATSGSIELDHTELDNAINNIKTIANSAACGSVADDWKTS